MKEADLRRLFNDVQQITYTLKLEIWEFSGSEVI